MTTKKRFDCVDMMHGGAAKVQAALAGMSRQEHLDFWHKQTDELLERQRSAVSARKAS